ncbi:MAG: C40 family peptidase [Actinomycetales bacterium]|nr:C40 family peptidase [Actinomycetales bacterium]
MSRRWVRLLAATPFVLGAEVITVVALFAGSTTTSSVDDGTGLDACTVELSGVGPATKLDREQLENARTIIRVGSTMGIPRQGIVIALATAMQESGLRNLDYGHADSVGLFQQRPSQGWGSIEQLTDPETSARKFYAALLQVRGWSDLAVTVAAQSVQRSAFPDAYAKWEPLAVKLAGGSSVTCAQTLAVTLPDGAVGDMLQVALAQQGDPYVWGATGPDAFDCSGLIVYAWRRAGYALSVRVADDMYRSAMPVAAGSERPGDLIFTAFGTRVPGAGHVMLVVHRGWAVEAPRAGLDVRLRRYDPMNPALRFGRLTSSVLQPLSRRPAATGESPEPVR